MNKLIALLAAGILVAAACGSDGSLGAAGTGTDAPADGDAPTDPDALYETPADGDAPTDADAPAGADAPADPDAPTDAPADADASADAPADADASAEAGIPAGEDASPPAGCNVDGTAVLTASARGVTETSIKIGIPQIDFAELNNLGLVELNRGDEAEAMRALAAEVNEQGGICGRTVEVVTAYYLPIGTDTALAGCIHLTEDEEVFAVLGGFVGVGGTDAANLCVVETHDTALIGAGFTSEQLARASAPWVSTDIVGERVAAVFVTALEAAGIVEEMGDVAVHSDVDTRPVVDGVLVPALEAAGVNIVERTVLDAPAGDVQAGASQWRTFLELYRSAGVDTVFMEGDLNFGLEQLVRSGLDVRVFSTNTGWLLSALMESSDPSALRAISIQAAGFSGTDRNQRMQACYDTFEARTGIEVVSYDDLGEDEVDWEVSVDTVCLKFDLFVQLATAAGPELNNDTLQAAIDTFGPIELPNQPYASLGEGKYDTPDGFVLTEFDPTLGADGKFVAITEVINTAG